ncbi:MAG: hypothetical protein HY791_05830 [Deltaproteobacteria bacterium]|nr:hypothetical protein [Deltaproteobacteria bacterium]
MRLTLQRLDSTVMPWRVEFEFRQVVMSVLARNLGFLDQIRDYVAKTKGNPEYTDSEVAPGIYQYHSGEILDLSSAFRCPFFMIKDGKYDDAYIMRIHLGWFDRNTPVSDLYMWEGLHGEALTALISLIEDARGAAEKSEMGIYETEAQLREPIDPIALERSIELHLSNAWIEDSSRVPHEARFSVEGSYLSLSTYDDVRYMRRLERFLKLGRAADARGRKRTLDLSRNFAFPVILKARENDDGYVATVRFGRSEYIRWTGMRGVVLDQLLDWLRIELS